MRSIARALFVVVLAGLGPGFAAPARGLDRAARIDAQRVIERVFWSHRIWPASNPGPKPALEAVLSEAELAAKVDDYLAKSNALGAIWDRPIAAEQLQQELDRMAASTRDAVVLRELFEALGDDPALIAETLARQSLAERLVRAWYAHDSRFHGSLRARAEAARAACAAAACMREMGGEYRETTGASSAEPEALPIGTLGAVEETDDGFAVTTVLSQRAEEVQTASVVWAKQPFDAWWSAERETRAANADIAGTAGADYRLPAIAEAGCANDTWSPTHMDLPDPRTDHTAVWTGSEMIVWGGSGNTGGRYNPATDTWVLTSTGANAPTGRNAHSAVWTGTQMIVWGGNGKTGALNTGGRYNPVTDTWLPTSTSTAPPARYYHSAVWTGTQMIVWGGRDSFAAQLNTGGRYDSSKDAWTPTSTGANLPAVRSQHTAVWSGTVMVVWGGYDGSAYLNTGGRYTPSTDTWATTSTAGANPTGRYLHSAVWTGTQMVVWGGYGTTGAVNTGGRYNPSTNAWTATSTGANAPSARYWHSAVWSGTQMLVWGGHFPINTGGRYNPSTNVWTTMSVGANVPEERSRHTAVWTGTEMIVWGGATFNSALNTGGRYAPATDSWVATSTAGNTPSARYNHAAVWTGAEMIVWGGIRDAYVEYATGGRYTPSTDTWLPTSLGANVPSARYWPTGVWTGTEMIVWGGAIDNNGTMLNTGGRYKPSTDSWTATSTGANLPAERVNHTAVWTGTRMIVWGGRNTGGSLNSGGRYDPAADTWLATSIGAGVPDGRIFHTAEWTGTRMIVWGGQTPPNLIVNTGGRYDPATDQWSSTSVGANVPTPRALHSSVWTGNEMIIWGGTIFGISDFNTGGRYDPGATPGPRRRPAPESRSGAAVTPPCGRARR